MKTLRKEENLLSGFNCVRLCVFIATILLSASLASAQPKKHIPIKKGITVVPPKKIPPPQPSVKYLHYRVTINGEGEFRKDEWNAIVFTINRKYSGVAMLDTKTVMPKPPAITPGMTSAEMVRTALAGKDAHTLQWTPNIGLNQLRNMDVTISDRVATISTSHGENKSYEQTTTIKEWKLEPGSDFTLNGGLYDADVAAEKYNVTISILPVNQIEWLRITEKIEIDRSLLGYAGKPQIERKTLPTKSARSESVQIPTIFGLLEGGVIHHAEPKFLNILDSEVEFDSGDLTPSRPLIEGIPDSKDKVKIRVFYKVTSQKELQ